MKEREDWSRFLDEIGISAKEAERFNDSLADSKFMEAIAGPVVHTESETYEVRASDVHGLGVFAKIDIPNSCLIGLAMSKGKDKYRGLIGRYTNHSADNNAKLVDEYDLVLAVATRPIQSGEEILVNYADHWGKY